jgi:hypothetical protein
MGYLDYDDDFWTENRADYWENVKTAFVPKGAVHFKAEITELELGFDEQALINQLAPQISKGLQEIANSVVDVAKARCPVGEERDFNPNPKSFQRLKLVPLGTFGPTRLSKAAGGLSEFSGMSSVERAARFKRKFGSETSNPLATRYFQGTTKANKGKTPTTLRIGRTITGAFRHEPGTLKKSIHFAGVERQGDTLIATIAVDAPYARYVHDGPRTRGSSRVAGRPFLKSALINARERFFNPSTYQG